MSFTLTSKTKQNRKVNITPDENICKLYPNDYFKVLLSNFDAYYKKKLEKRFANQTLGSCVALYNLTKIYQPNKIVELGTCAGASTLAFATALNDMGISLKNLTTIDKNLDFWHNVTPDIQSGLLKGKGIGINQICSIENNFLILNPRNYVLPLKKTLLFYDIHDEELFSSKLFLDQWIPAINNGLVVLHDFLPAKPYERVDNSTKKRLRTKAVHFSGIAYKGYPEVAIIVHWLNQNEIQIAEFDGGIWFELPKHH